jgi:hypothetical protein
MKKEWVDDDNDWKRIRTVIAERWLRVPSAAFLYAVGGLEPGSTVSRKDGN